MPAIMVEVSNVCLKPMCDMCGPLCSMLYAAARLPQRKMCRFFGYRRSVYELSTQAGNSRDGQLQLIRLIVAKRAQLYPPIAERQAGYEGSCLTSASRLIAFGCSREPEGVNINAFDLMIGKSR